MGGRVAADWVSCVRLEGGSMSGSGEGPGGAGASGDVSAPGSAAASATTTPRLFVRQSSGLVRNVSVTNALFFNVAAFVGVGLTLYPIFYSLADVQAWKTPLFSAYGWAAIVS